VLFIDPCYYSYAVKQRKNKKGGLNKRNVIVSVKRKPRDARNKLGLEMRRNVRREQDHVNS